MHHLLIARLRSIIYIRCGRRQSLPDKWLWLDMKAWGRKKTNAEQHVNLCIIQQVSFVVQLICVTKEGFNHLLIYVRRRLVSIPFSAVSHFVIILPKISVLVNWRWLLFRKWYRTLPVFSFTTMEELKLVMHDHCLVRNKFLIRKYYKIYITCEFRLMDEKCI